MGAKNKKKNNEEVRPMPSLIFHEGSIENQSDTPMADQIEKELRTPPKLPSLKHLEKYNPSAHRLMWLSVILLATIVAVMWGWSIYFQLSSIKWSKSAEGNLVSAVKESWKESFYKENGEKLNSDDQINLIKSNLNKLFSGAAATSSQMTSTSTVSSTP